jgi:hypothetical protein
VRATGVLRWASLLVVVTTALIVESESLPLLIMTALAIACLDTTQHVSVRNIVVIYHLMLLGLGPHLLYVSDRQQVQIYGCLLFFTFLAGICARRIYEQRRSQRSRGGRPTSALTPREPARPAAQEETRRAPPALVVVAGLQVGLLLMALSRYGLAAYLSGGSLSGRISSYAQIGGLDALGIASALVGVLTVALVAVYAAQAECDRVYSWRWLIIALVIAPALRLDRAALVINAIGLLFFAAREGRAVGARRSGRVVLLVMAIAVAGVAAFGIGALRSDALVPVEQGGDASIALVAGELSPVLVVADGIRAPDGQYAGTDLALSMVTRFVPRRFFPQKPPNTITRYMMQKDPAAFRNGYSLAPTALGVLLLNFGATVTLGVALLAGAIFTARRETRPRADRIGAGAAAVLYLSIYTLLRDDPSNSVPTAGLALIAFRLLWLVHEHRAKQRRQRRFRAEVCRTQAVVTRA